ncbi:MAG TPA: response regulator [Acidobacteriaceae bacterium]|nr:response regulator [Acidobacteriaceae bacterium]
MASAYAVCASVPLSHQPAVLVVDDDPTFLHLVPATLTRTLPHVMVETCPSAQLAATKLAEGHYDAAITDLSMPELDGFGVLSHALDARPCTPIIFITGKKELALAEQAFRQGAFDFVPKPLDRDRLRWSVDLAIQTHRLRRRIEERRVYLNQLREVMTRRWEKPLSVHTANAVEPSRSLMGAPFERMEELVGRSERVIERAERLLRRRQAQVQHDARQRLQSS